LSRRYSQPLARRDDLLFDLRLSGSNRRFEFHKRSQLFIRTHNKTLPLRCASTIQIVRPLESMAETQPQLQPALLRLSAVIRVYDEAGNVIETHEQAGDSKEP